LNERWVFAAFSRQRDWGIRSGSLQENVSPLLALAVDVGGVVSVPDPTGKMQLVLIQLHKAL